MKRMTWMIIGLCTSLSLATLTAGFGEEAGSGSSAGSTEAGKGSSGTVDTGETKDAPKGLGTSSLTRGTSAGKPKPAGTGTAAGYILDQAKQGNIKIEGAIDGDDWDKPD